MASGGAMLVGGMIALAIAASSISSGGTRTIAVRVSPSSKLMIRTPWVLRPMTLISLAATRWILPRTVIIINSSVSSTGTIPTTRPLRLVVLMSITPLPPRRCVRYRFAELRSSTSSSASSTTSSSPGISSPFSSTSGTATSRPTISSPGPNVVRLP